MNVLTGTTTGMGAGSAATTSTRRRVPTDGDITTATAGPVAIQGIVVLRGMVSVRCPISGTDLRFHGGGAGSVPAYAFQFNFSVYNN